MSRARPHRAKERTAADRRIALLHLLTSLESVDHLTVDSLARSFGLPEPAVAAELEGARLRKMAR